MHQLTGVRSCMFLPSPSFSTFPRATSRPSFSPYYPPWRWPCSTWCIPAAVSNDRPGSRWIRPTMDAPRPVELGGTSCGTLWNSVHWEMCFLWAKFKKPNAVKVWLRIKRRRKQTTNHNQSIHHWVLWRDHWVDSIEIPNLTCRQIPKQGHDKLWSSHLWGMFDFRPPCCSFPTIMVLERRQSHKEWHSNHLTSRKVLIQPCSTMLNPLFHMFSIGFCMFLSHLPHGFFRYRKHHPGWRPGALLHSTHCHLLGGKLLRSSEVRAVHGAVDSIYPLVPHNRWDQMGKIHHFSMGKSW